MRTLAFKLLKNNCFMPSKSTRLIQLFIIGLGHLNSISAQHSILNSIMDTRALGMGRTGLALKNNNNFLNNTAHLSLLDNSGIYANARSYYLVEGLGQINIQGFYHSHSNDAWGITGSFDGSKDLNESVIGIAYSRKINNNSSAGIGLNYYQENLPENSSISSVYPTFGMQIQIIPKFTLATQINNPIPINTKSSK
ncbi:MAG: hypothetical protein ABIO44_09840, partial [Saprospiraceae bacterium]